MHENLPLICLINDNYHEWYTISHWVARKCGDCKALFATKW